MTSEPSHLDTLLQQSDPAQTLFLVPCCKAKLSGGIPNARRTGIVDHIPTDLGRELLQARNSVATRAALDERLLLAASDRYQGHFYTEIGNDLRGARERGLHVLIISGGYGVVMPEEPIGTYEAQFSPRQWPRDLLERILLGYAREHQLRHVRAFFAATTQYKKAVTGLSWRDAGVGDALIIAPIVKGGGSQRKSPQAQAEAFRTALDRRLSCRWRSRSGIPISVISMMPL